jgi:elongation factor 1-alpha
VLKVNDQIVVAPGQLTSEVRSIEMFHQEVTEAGPGDNIGFNVRGLSVKDLRRGAVIGHVKNEPPLQAVDFVAQISTWCNSPSIKRVLANECQLS